MSIPSFNADSEQGFYILKKIPTDHHPLLKQSTLIALMSIKFNCDQCCHDSTFSKELTNSKKATAVHNKQ